MYRTTTTFSILERIDVGETPRPGVPGEVSEAFSILERIDVGETTIARPNMSSSIYSFSILERIDVGETRWLFGLR